MSRIMDARFAGRCRACGCDFPAGTMIRWEQGAGARHASSAACAAANAAKPQQLSLLLNLTPIIDFLNAAKTRGLKRPMLRVLDVDGVTELRLGLTIKGVEPGSVKVKRAHAGLGSVYVGVVRVSGETRGIDETLAAHLLKVAENPIDAAKRYAALMGSCCFCGLRLTDEGSVEVGYGPVCAEHWGLPHEPKGTPKLELAYA